MLYDPKWEKKTKPQTLETSLAGFVAWLETQEPNGTYNWADCSGHCLCDQFFSAVGANWSLHHSIYKKTGVRLDGIAYEEPWTYGAALKRARQALSAGQEPK